MMTQISKHNHPTNKIVYESYSAPTSQVLSLPVYRELGLLQDMKTSSADVNRYLSDKLDMILTPQQTRNILQQVLGTTILERTKRILDSFAEEDVGNDVLIVQVQMDITYIIAIRTAIPKTCFLEWVMPSLVVTSATERGVHVVDFPALDQKAGTMELILNFFKQKKSVMGFYSDRSYRQGLCGVEGIGEGEL
ncbi:hypothetical protein PHMEG_00017628 [Phytophthora megakarya]|uniref:Uncharacterized protein n=1 Tax=Phytophthora megakarya TaxID=4795 RepID=A0A225VW12_9STRA|nr:hypothetical protein PHMEG_00017628 [Phytophthora megakarya]